MALKQRVAIYVTRKSATGLELLVFDHRDHPEAGTQVPAGGLEPDETVMDAAMREVREETGLADVVVERTLVCSDAHTSTPHSAVRRSSCRHRRRRMSQAGRTTSPGDGSDAGLVFDCSFVPLANAVGLLMDKQGEFLPAIA